MTMTRGIQLSTLSARSTGEEGGLDRSDRIINNNGSKGRMTDDGQRVLRKRKSGVCLVEEARGVIAVSSPRAARYSARSARKSSVHETPAAASIRKRASRESMAPSNTEDSIPATTALAAISAPRRRNVLLSPLSYSALVTISIALLAWTIVLPAQAALSCQVSHTIQTLQCYIR